MSRVRQPPPFVSPHQKTADVNEREEEKKGLFKFSFKFPLSSPLSFLQVIQVLLREKGSNFSLPPIFFIYLLQSFSLCSFRDTPSKVDMSKSPGELRRKGGMSMTAQKTSLHSCRVVHLPSHQVKEKISQSQTQTSLSQTVKLAPDSWRSIEREVRSFSIVSKRETREVDC